MMIKTKLKHICRLHAEMIALMTEVRKDTDGVIDFFDESQGDEIQLVRGISRIAEELNAGIMKRKDADYIECENQKIVSMFRD